ncbi:hypothetical protein Pst134EA_030468 [Puccinia striiformis f. sp. tritici]|uniref:hypothetical protein n=1 Tax=Puccinia striiformis f. sp. tritici TaxID=168172 RepID=UPI0020073E02|nr:hypothetical protein Pst134EA_030468 [Puccinia striiformis f. sp. tritici]KAH9440387.1 hypothetical protein Pst134EB_031004 [Puccinia striiformis f. sp. tritici]KAH9446556.1 hypothetical protein Pst134EA_030468 [Puccinia striiformis f. sp. tritici]KAI9600527.1 hypothetical protein H4Q26_000311 [Puccinia striiformis f. sp. tritici PST-130]KAI9602134.1 hypothetical protein KEM48_000161 [Puccinia striiformis f. sp. tritici PST-130]
MLFLNFSLAIAVLSMVQGRSAAVNSFQCKNSDKSQALCSHANGDTTVVEKAYPDGLGYYCSSNIKDAKQNCCNADFKIGATYPGIPKTVQTSSVSQNCDVAVVTSFQCPNPDKAQALCTIVEGTTARLVKPFPSGRNYFCPVWLVNPLKSCCNTDFKIKYLLPGNNTAVPASTFSSNCQ